MDTMAPQPAHVLSGHNPTLFNAVVQYADMDMLRTLALTSHSTYEVLQKCQFDHLTVVVLEAPILHAQQQVALNGADPVPADTFRLRTNDMGEAPLVEMPSLALTSSQTKDGGTFLDMDIVDSWQWLYFFHNEYGHDLVIPNYARNFIACAQSVELVVYRRRLGTRISTFFITNAHRLKHGRSTPLDECISCVESNCHGESPSVAPQYKLHPACSPAPHVQQCNLDGEGGVDNSPGPPSDDSCVFSEHCSYEYFEGESAESRRLRSYMFTDPSPDGTRRFPYDDLMSLQLKIPPNTTDAVLENVVDSGDIDGRRKKRIKRRRHIRDILYRDGHPFIVAGVDNTRLCTPRFQNLPLIEQQTPTTSLKVRIVDCLSFGAEDWCNAMPGCKIQPIQTWVIRDRTWASQHPHHPAQLNIGHHFPHLTSLVLQHTRMHEANRCGIDEFSISTSTDLGQYTPLPRFFIGHDMHLPHLQHFGVVGTLLDPREYATIALYNAHVTSLNIDPGLQPTSNVHVLGWMARLNHALDLLEDFDTLEDYDDDDADEQACRHHDPPSQQHYRGGPQQLESAPCPRRKYNFSFDFASSCLESCCPHDVHILMQKNSTNTLTRPKKVTRVSAAPGEDHSQFDQHFRTCALIRDALVAFYRNHTNDPGNTYEVFLSESPPLRLAIPNPPTFRPQDISAVIAIARLARRTLTYLELRCHYCSHANPGTTLFPGASPGDCTTTQLPPSANMPLGPADSTRDDADEGLKMYMRLRQLLHIPERVVLRL